jgi:hypothetical protein
MTLFTWSKTASNNATADATINWAEGQSPSSVNDSARATMAGVAKFRDDNNGSITTGGSSTAYAATSNQVFDSLAHLDKQQITIVPHTTSGASPTLNVDSLGAKAINYATGQAVASGALVQATPYRLTYYNATNEFILEGQVAAVTGAFTFGGAVTFSSTTSFTGKASFTSTDSMAIAKGTTAQRNGSPTAGDLRFNSTTNTPEVYDGSGWDSLIPPSVAPQGYLTLISATPVITADVTAAATVYYTPFTGALIPIWNGTNMALNTFAELSLTLNSNHAADTVYDVFVFLNSGTVTVGTGPAWSNSGAGTGARGSGAGTTQLARQNGIWTNAVQITTRNDANTYTVSANQATYVGSLYIDHTAGQVSCHVSYGQNRKWGVWNGYNRQPILLKAGDSTASWSYGTNTIRASNNVPSAYGANSFNVGSGTTCNGMVLLQGLAEERYDIRFVQHGSASANANTNSTCQMRNGIGINSTTASSGKRGALYFQKFDPGSDSIDGDMKAEYQAAPALGLTNVCALEVTPSPGNATGYNGTETEMVLSVAYRG